MTEHHGKKRIISLPTFSELALKPLSRALQVELVFLLVRRPSSVGNDSALFD